MAITEHFEVTILVDGKPAPEYDDDEFQTDPNTPDSVSKYVEVGPGSKFAFNVTVLPSYSFSEEDAITFNVTIDGRRIGKTVLSDDRVDRYSERGRGFVIKSARGADGMRFMFRFANLETRDANVEDLATIKKKYATLGSLQVHVYRVRTTGHVARPSKWNPNAEWETVPEKALKGRAIAVGAKLEPCPDTRPRRHKFHREKLDKHPISMFNFHYRTRASLQTEMIIPQSPSPGFVEERKLEELTAEEMRAIIRSQRAKQAVEEPPNLKRERAVSLSTPPRPLKSSKTNDGKTIIHVDTDDESDG